MGLDMATILYSLPAVITGLTVHEYSHAWMASRLGDNTAKDQGRITFNPLKHIDPLGMIFIVFAGFGWAKPVSFNPDNLVNPRRDKALIAAAGPASNLVLGIALLFLVKVLLSQDASAQNSIMNIIVNVLFYMSVINLGLFMFNILPFPPLDGSHIFFSGINLKRETEQKIMKYGTYVLFLVIIVERQTELDLLPIGSFINKIVKFVFSI